MDSVVLGFGASGCGCCAVRGFEQNLALEDAIGSHTVSTRLKLEHVCEGAISVVTEFMVDVAPVEA
jgi:hypothetical protein